MAFSMHSHSGQFCPGHAKDSLEEIIQRAISLKMHLLALTEHMPRDQDQDLYPEELIIYNKIAAGTTIASLLPLHHAYITEALRLRTKYATQITLLIGFEGEWIRPLSSCAASSPASIPSLRALPGADPSFFIGSVHHVHEIPIDFDRATYERARAAAASGVGGGSSEEEKRLFEAYFDAQADMLEMLRPAVVGHFDLVRLWCDEPDWGRVDGEGNRETEGKGRIAKGVWEKILRNLKAIVRMGALMEINSSALRKGLKEPYPCRAVCEAFLALGGKLTLSDDSHGVAQVGLNYGRVSDYLLSLGVTELFYLDRRIPAQERQPHEQERDEEDDHGSDSRQPLIVKSMPFSGFEKGWFPETGAA